MDLNRRNTPEALTSPEKIDRSLSRYMKEIADCQPLSSAEEAELARRIKLGDIKARNKLVRANLRFVITIALEYRNRGLTLGEVISAGNGGLFTAAERFDQSRGCRFISYAVWWVRQAILQAVMSRRTVRIPVNRFDLLSRSARSYSGLQQKLSADPGTGDIAKDLGVSLRDLERTLLDGRDPVSFDAPFEEGSDQNLLQVLADPAQGSLDEDLDRKRMRNDISNILETLNSRESEVLRLYFGLKDGERRTLEQIGAHLGITRERVRQIKEGAIQKLRHTGRARRLRPYLESI